MEGVNFSFEWEVRLMVFLQSHASSLSILLATIFTHMGAEVVMLAIIGYTYWALDKNMGEIIGINSLIGAVVNPLFKNIFLRRRPYFDHSEIRCLKAVNESADIYDISKQGYSFPSGHSTNSMIMYGSIAYLTKNKYIRSICILLPLFVGLSRNILGVHYPTDVYAGWLLGIVIILSMHYLNKIVKDDFKFHLCILALSSLGIFYCKTTDYYTGLGLLTGFIFGFQFERKYVNFLTTDSKLYGCLRVLGGFVLYFGLNILLKLPFSKDLLNSATALSFMIRTIRYSIISFTIIGVYPICFKYLDRKAG